MKKGKILISHERSLHRPEHRCHYCDRALMSQEGMKPLQQWLKKLPNYFSFGQPKEKPSHPIPHWEPTHFHMDTTIQRSSESQKGLQTRSQRSWGEQVVLALRWRDSRLQSSAPGDTKVLPEGGFQENPPVLCTPWSSTAPRCGIALEEGAAVSLPCQNHMNNFTHCGHSKLLFKLLFFILLYHLCMNPSASNLSSTPSKLQHEINP